MNFEPPDFTKDVALPSRNSNMQQFRNNQNQNNKFQSPLLQQPQTKFEKSVPSGVQNHKFNSLNHNNYNNHNGAVYNRLGHRNSYRPNNTSNNTNLNTNLNQQNNRNFNRKRPGDLNSIGPVPPRRKWKPNKRSFYQNTNQNTSSVQDRINRIRSINNVQTDEDEMVQFDPRNEEKPEPDLNESQDVDAADITVEVINHNVQPREESNLVRFKMILDPKTQTAIKMIQQKRKDKQVIFPFPVTPNVTEVTLHERFGML